MIDILLTNDDGYKSIGFIPLLKELSKDFSVMAITSPGERSWASKAITTKKELELKKVKIEGLSIFLLDGTPADCVQVGIHNILKKYPKMVVSGINNGPNIGRGRIFSSGTVGAAIEAAISGVRAVASSFCPYRFIHQKPIKKIDFFNPQNYPLFKNAAEITAKLIKILIRKDFGKDIDLFSINIPFGATVHSDFETAKLFKSPDWKLFYKRGNKIMHQKTSFINLKELQKDTDFKALRQGKISITPINLDLTSEKLLKKFRRIIKKEW